MAKSGFAAGQLRSIVERVEQLEEEKSALTTDIREVYAEAKANGFDTKILREVVKQRKLETADRREREAVLELYKAALGMLDGTPLGEATLERISREVRAPRKRETVDAETGEVTEEKLAAE